MGKIDAVKIKIFQYDVKEINPNDIIIHMGYQIRSRLVQLGRTWSSIWKDLIKLWIFKAYTDSIYIHLWTIQILDTEGEPTPDTVNLDYSCFYISGFTFLHFLLSFGDLILHSALLIILRFLFPK